MKAFSSTLEEMASLVVSLQDKGLNPSSEVEIVAFKEGDLFHSRFCANDHSHSVTSMREVFTNPDLWHHCLGEASLVHADYKTLIFVKFEDLLFSLREADDLDILIDYREGGLEEHLLALRKLIALDMVASQSDRGHAVFRIFSAANFQGVDQELSRIGFLSDKICMKLATEFKEELADYVRLPYEVNNGLLPFETEKEWDQGCTFFHWNYGYYAQAISDMKTLSRKHAWMETESSLLVFLEDLVESLVNYHIGISLHLAFKVSDTLTSRVSLLHPGVALGLLRFNAASLPLLSVPRLEPLEVEAVMNFARMHWPAVQVEDPGAAYPLAFTKAWGTFKAL